MKPVCLESAIDGSLRLAIASSLENGWPTGAIQVALACLISLRTGER